MQAGQLRHKLDIETELNIRDTYGQTTHEWVVFLHGLWAAIEPLTGREYYAAQQVNAEISHRIKIRYKGGIKPKMRVKYGDRYFNILAVLDITERHREIHLMCTEVIA
ncbi:phage head closure protein [Desulfosporosinus sp. Sb-LF]|uniref:phage head closure protein n=1 Tax=Desulfosporosinus sp. Sb-LF TaxID=2560027 RepID=UPI00107F3A76|nr:phage head closure protein [Desulfosporosinus sp. Sb-LF]TGE31326.1 head-tail adaptor protein [Desulfosporosinus sp. Sb-LF]